MSKSIFVAAFMMCVSNSSLAAQPQRGPQDDVFSIVQELQVGDMKNMAENSADKMKTSWFNAIEKYNSMTDSEKSAILERPINIYGPGSMKMGKGMGMNKQGMKGQKGGRKMKKNKKGGNGMGMGPGDGTGMRANNNGQCLTCGSQKGGKKANRQNNGQCANCTNQGQGNYFQNSRAKSTLAAEIRSWDIEKRDRFQKEWKDLQEFKVGLFAKTNSLDEWQNANDSYISKLESLTKKYFTESSAATISGQARLKMLHQLQNEKVRAEALELKENQRVKLLALINTPVVDKASLMDMSRVERRDARLNAMDTREKELRSILDDKQLVIWQIHHQGMKRNFGKR